MSVASDLITALTGTGLPVAQTVYTGIAASYITFAYATEAEEYANDIPYYERYKVQVHLITPATQNTTALEAQIKTLLVGAGFVYPKSADATNDPTVRHILFETETEVFLSA